jgi:Xaa-Pro aminopeptidase
MEFRIVIRNSLNRADMRHLCGTELPDAAVLILKGREKKLIVSEMEYSRMKRTVRRGITVLHPPMIGSSWKNGAADWIKKSICEEMQILVSEDFPLGTAEKLRAAGVKIKISKDPLCPQREIKTAEESAAVQKAQQAAAAAMKAAIQQISSARIGADGRLLLGKTVLTSERVRAAIHRTLLDAECAAPETIVSCGPASADPHERGTGPLLAGAPIVLDIFPQSYETGYWGDLTRTVCRGPAPEELKKMYTAVRAAQTAALKKIKSGVRADQVHLAAAAELERRGFKTETVNGRPQGFIHGTRHGVGLEIHEDPRVSGAVRKKLRAGHIITVEPGLYYPHIGGVRIEDTVAVTREGYKRLAACPHRFQI